MSSPVSSRIRSGHRNDLQGVATNRMSRHDQPARSGHFGEDRTRHKMRMLWAQASSDWPEAAHCALHHAAPVGWVTVAAGLPLL